MDLHNQQIVIRERGIAEIMDLALPIIRKMGLPVLLALAAGAVPMLLLDAWLLSDTLEESLLFDLSEPPAAYLYLLGLLIIVQAPLATAPATILLGSTMFGQPIRASRIARDLLALLPQIVLFQILLRGFLVGILFFFPVLPFVLLPFLGEIVLLERNPLFSGRSKQMTTLRRAFSFHSGLFGEIFSRFLASAIVGALLIGSVWFSLWTILNQLSGRSLSTHTIYLWYLPLSLWIVVGFFTVVRFLSYLDLRIRREGWEVELDMRAEAARLSAILE